MWFFLFLFLGVVSWVLAVAYNNGGQKKPSTFCVALCLFFFTLAIITGCHYLAAKAPLTHG